LRNSVGGEGGEWGGVPAQEGCLRRIGLIRAQQPGTKRVLDSRAENDDVDWQPTKTVLRKEYRREDQYLCIEIQPYLVKANPYRELCHRYERLAGAAAPRGDAHALLAPFVGRLWRRTAIRLPTHGRDATGATHTQDGYTSISIHIYTYIHV